MQDKRMNSNEPLSDKQMENVSGGEMIILVHPHPMPAVTCKCGHTFYAPCNVSNTYQCPVCKEIFTVDPGD